MLNLLGFCVKLLMLLVRMFAQQPAHLRAKRTILPTACQPPPLCAGTFNQLIGGASCTTCPAGSTSAAGATSCGITVPNQDCVNGEPG